MDPKEKTVMELGPDCLNQRASILEVAATPTSDVISGKFRLVTGCSVDPSIMYRQSPLMIPAFFFQSDSASYSEMSGSKHDISYYRVDWVKGHTSL